MKKVLSFALAICMTLILSVPTFADGRGPAFTTYEIVCTKETPYYQENWDNDGAWEKKGTFPTGTTLEVDYEYEKDGVLYGDVRIGSSDEDWEWVYVRLSDVEMKNDTYLPENAQKLSRTHTVRVVEKGGIPMYAGPNKRYAKISTVPRSTKLTYSYGNDEDDYYRTWAYVTYLGKSGWIYVYASDTKNGVVELPEEDDKTEIWALEDDVQMFSGMSFGNMENELSENYGVEVIREKHEEPDRVVGTLEKGKKYTYRYSHAQDYGTWYYVTAGLRAGWVFMSDENSRIAASATSADQDNYMAFKTFSLKLRETPRENADGTSVSIAKETVLPVDFKVRRDYDEYYYATIEGKSGWYAREDIGNTCAYKVDNTYGGYWNRNETDEDAPIYSDPVALGKTVGNIPAGGLFTPLYYGNYETQIDEENSEWTYFYYVRYNDVTGWVMEEDLWTPDDEQEDETVPEEEAEDYTEWEEDEDWDDTEWMEDDEDEGVEEYIEYTAAPQSGLSPLQIVLICVGGAAVLALTAAVTLVLIRRKRRSAAAPAAESEPAAEPRDEPETEPADETDEPS